MLTRKRPQDANAQRLLTLYGELDQPDRATLLALAEFLRARADVASPEQPPAAIPAPKELPRPERESVVAAMRRLSETYHMLDKGAVLHQASALMGAHVMHGKAAAEVIDELERLFQQAYQRLLQD